MRQQVGSESFVSVSGFPLKIGSQRSGRPLLFRSVLSVSSLLWLAPETVERLVWLNRSLSREVELQPLLSSFLCPPGHQD